MQNTAYRRIDHSRFLFYNYDDALKLIKRGAPYEINSKVYQILLINGLSRKSPRFVQHLSEKDQDGLEDENTFNFRAIVYLPKTKEILKEKGSFDKMTDFELVCYIFAYGPNDAILCLDREMVNILMNKFDEMHQDPNFYDWQANARECKRVDDARWLEIEQEYKQLWREEGKEEGKEKGKREGLMECTRNLIEFKFHVDASKWLDQLNSNQLHEATLSILSCTTFKELKDNIEEKAPLHIT